MYGLRLNRFERGAKMNGNLGSRGVIPIRKVDTQLDNQMIYKSNLLNSAHFQMSSLEYRLLLLLIAQVQRSDTHLRYRFATQDIIDYFKLGKSKSSYGAVRDAVESLHTQTLEIQGEKHVEKHNWLITSIYYREAGYFILELNPNLKKYCLDLNGNFLRYHLHNVLTLPNLYAIRIYELLVQESYKGDVHCIPVTKLREFLGVPDDTYVRVSDFKRKVILRSCELINSSTDLQVTVEDVKEGRRVVEFEFTTMANPSKKQVSGQHIYSAKVANLLTELDIPANAIQPLVAKYGEPLLIQEATHFLTYRQDLKDKKRAFKRHLERLEVEQYNNVQEPLQTEPIEPRKVAKVKEPGKSANIENSPVYSALVDFGAPVRRIRGWMKAYPESFILQTLNEALMIMERKEIKYPVAYLDKMLENTFPDYVEVDTKQNKQAQVSEYPPGVATQDPVEEAALTEVESEVLVLYSKYQVEKGFIHTQNQLTELHLKYSQLLSELIARGLTESFIKEHCTQLVEALNLKEFQAHA